MVLLHFKVGRGGGGGAAARRSAGWRTRCMQHRTAGRLPSGAHVPANPTRRRRPQNSEQDQFLFETPGSQPAGAAARDLAELHNLRHRIARLKLEGGELAQYGPAKAPDAQGIDSCQEEAGGSGRERGPHYCMDPTGRRSGEGERARACACSCRFEPPAAACAPMRPHAGPAHACMLSYTTSL